VAIQGDLTELAALLRQGGYEVVPLEECDTPVDAIVYSGVTCAWDGAPGITDSLEPGGPGQRVVLINAVNMDPGEAADFIGSRLG